VTVNRPQRLKSQISNQALYAALKCCATQKQISFELALLIVLLPQLSAVYCALKVRKISQERCAMSAKALEEVSAQIPSDDFQELEAKVYRTIEMYKAAREAKAVAERDGQRLREQLEEREEEVDTLRRDIVKLRKDREEIRSRVEKMLQQIEAVAGEQAAS
jgi:predicted  nucleic acid-binding Zn-ribbon protein